jgi:hypothetical protein
MVDSQVILLALVIGRPLISRLAAATQRISASCLAAWWVPRAAAQQLEAKKHRRTSSQAYDGLG